mgnify:CR=1 FL=1
MIKLLVIEDHPITIDGLKCVFSEDEDIDIAYSAYHIDHAIELNKYDFDAILLDLLIGNTNPLDNIRRLIDKYPNKPIIIFTCEDSPTWKNKMFEAGAIAYLVKTTDIKEIVETIKNVIKKNLKVKEEEKYKGVFENNVFGICHMDSNGKYVIMNNRYAKLFGYSSCEDMLNNTEKDNANTDVREKLKELILKDDIVNYEVQLKRRNGEKWWCSVNAKLIKNENDEGSYVECFIEDVTDKRETIENYVSLLKAIPDMMTRIRKDGLIMDIKPGEGIFHPEGQSTSMIGHNLDELPFGQVVVEEFKKVVSEVIEKNEPVEFYYSIDIKGDDRYFYSRTVKTGDDEVIVVIKDTTEETRISRELLYAKEYAENLINTANLLVVNLDDNGNVVGLNNRAEETTGYKREEIIGKNWFETTVPKNVFPEVWEIFEKTISRSDGFVSKFENPILTKNGEIRHISWRNNIIEKRGLMKGTISFGMDITEHKKLEEELRIAKEKAEQSDKMKLEYLANMSHDLRTPMNAIIGFSDLLRTNNLTKTDKQEYITTIINNGKYLMALIDDIIDISKIDAGSLKIEMKDFELNKLMEELRLTYLKQIKDKNIDIIIDIDVNKNIILNSDKYRLRQIMANLIGNAVKFTNEGFVKFGYKVLNNKQLEIYVEDTGIGIEKKNYKMIFERFHQLNGSGKNKGGAGLGLSITKSLIELLGWREIKIFSEPGKGSRFYFIVPYVTKHFNYMNEVKNLKHKKINLMGKTILIVEDNLDSRTIVKSYLNETHASIIEMTDGIGVLDCIKNNKVDLVLLDIGLPGKDGYSVLEEIREYDARLPVIIESALVMSDQKTKAYELGADDFISKPYSKEDFLNKIDNLI